MLNPATIRRPLLATRSRRRMMAIAVTALLFSLFSAAVEVMLPLWVTRGLKMTDVQWTQLRSLRFAGVFAGVVLLGALSDRFGQRLLAAFAMLGTAVLLVAISFYGKAALWFAMPVFGALVSTAFVNMNTLTQQVSDARQGVANTIYRGIGAAAGIVAPAAATGLAMMWGGYPRVMLLCAVLLIGAAVAVWRYPGEQTPKPLGSLRAELARLWQGYRVAMKQRGLMGFLAVSQLQGNLLVGVGAFAAIRYTSELGHTDAEYGLLGTAAGILALTLTVAAGFYLDRMSLRLLHAVMGVLAGLCSLLMGLNNATPLMIIGLLGFIPITSFLAAPSSMWVSRAAGAGTQVSAFSVHKVVSAITVAIATWALGPLEDAFGMRLIFLYGGILGALSALLYFLLPEPPHARAAND